MASITTNPMGEGDGMEMRMENTEDTEEASDDAGDEDEDDEILIDLNKHLLDKLEISPTKRAFTLQMTRFDKRGDGKVRISDMKGEGEAYLIEFRDKLVQIFNNVAIVAALVGITALSLMVQPVQPSTIPFGNSANGWDGDFASGSASVPYGTDGWISKRTAEILQYSCA